MRIKNTIYKPCHVTFNNIFPIFFVFHFSSSYFPQLVMVDCIFLRLKCGLYYKYTLNPASVSSLVTDFPPRGLSLTQVFLLTFLLHTVPSHSPHPATSNPPKPQVQLPSLTVVTLFEMYVSPAVIHVCKRINSSGQQTHTHDTFIHA